MKFSTCFCRTFVGESEPKNSDMEISREVAELLIEEETSQVLDAMANDVSQSLGAGTESFEEKVVKAKVEESLESSMKTEDSDDWDKMSDGLIPDSESDSSERKKVLDHSKRKSMAKPTAAKAGHAASEDKADKGRADNVSCQVYYTIVWGIIPFASKAK